MRDDVPAALALIVYVAGLAVAPILINAGLALWLIASCAVLLWNALDEALRRSAAGGGDAGTLRVEDGEGLPPGASRDLPL